MSTDIISHHVLRIVHHKHPIHQHAAPLVGFVLAFVHNWFLLLETRCKCYEKHYSVMFLVVLVGRYVNIWRLGSMSCVVLMYRTGPL
ncbi:hypothetical protein NP493_1167g00026 [Ridgeia piscesae]|uniref:Uncharacterized protein n=1 Tax=Ridgeia piscesae TaxID=27915 RepID=A0AAD9KF24_RIDPI|nr:hypothetical protein NP493_1167g00026 [Ridgeia piscesae]